MHTSPSPALYASHSAVTYLSVTRCAHASTSASSSSIAFGGGGSVGAFDRQGMVGATNLLAKHDERYMPRELEGMQYNEATHEMKVEK